MSAGRLISAGLAAAMAGLLTWLFYARYWAHRDCIAKALSSCLVIYADGSEDNLTHGGMAWGVMALPLWALVAWLALGMRERGTRS